jgi:hypothetical protein
VEKQEKAIRIALLIARCGQRIGMLSSVRRSLPRLGRPKLLFPERRTKMDNKVKTGVCPISGGCDKLSCLLSKVGINRSLLVTLALLPFAWKGVNLLASGLASVWHTVNDAVHTVAK